MQWYSPRPFTASSASVDTALSTVVDRTTAATAVAPSISAKTLNARPRFGSAASFDGRIGASAGSMLPRGRGEDLVVTPLNCAYIFIAYIPR